VVLIAGLPLGDRVGYGPDGLRAVMYYAVPYVAATFAGAILIYQIAVALRTRQHPEELLAPGLRATGLVARALALSLVLFAAPLWWWIGVVPFAAAWLRGGRRSGRLLEEASSFGVAVALGWLFRGGGG
jgi:hypothetical protein